MEMSIRQTKYYGAHRILHIPLLNRLEKWKKKALLTLRTYSILQNGCEDYSMSMRRGEQEYVRMAPFMEDLLNLQEVRIRFL